MKKQPLSQKEINKFLLEALILILEELDENRVCQVQQEVNDRLTSASRSTYYRRKKNAGTA